MVVSVVAHVGSGRGAESEEIRHDQTAGSGDMVVRLTPVRVRPAEAVEQQNPTGVCAENPRVESAVLCLAAGPDNAGTRRHRSARTA